MLNRKTPPQVSLIEKINTPKISVGKINEIGLYYIESTNNDISEIIFQFNTGVWQQKHLLTASMTSRLITEGTKHHTSQQIADIFDLYGASFTKSTGMHATAFKLMALNKYLPNLIKIIAEIFNYPLFDKKEFNILRNETKQKFLIDLEEVETIAKLTIERNIYGKNYPYGWAAEPKDYDKLQIDWIKEYYNDNYTANNLNIIIVSNDIKNTTQILNENFANFRTSKKTNNREKYEVKPSEKYTYIEKESSHQTAIRVGWRLFDRKNPDYIDMIILNTILGGYFGSRLMQNIRQKLGLTYSIYSSLQAYKYDGTFQIISEVNKENKQKVIDEILKEITDLKQTPISNKELSSLKNYLMGAILSATDGYFNFASALSSFIIYDINFDFYDEFIEKLKNISPERIKQLANKYLDTNKMFTVIVG